MVPLKQPSVQLPVRDGQDGPALGPGSKSLPQARELAQSIGGAACGLWQLDLGLVPMFTMSQPRDRRR